MEVDPSIHIEVRNGVYEPAEDSYLLLDAIELRDGRMLDMGTGTGIIGLHAARHGIDVTAVDIDGHAVETARSNGTRNNLDITVLQSNLFTAVQGCFDIIAFNPPYLPAEDGDIRWDGGPGGIATARRFLTETDSYLKKDGRVYLLLSTLGDIASLLQEFKERYHFERKRQLTLFFEKLLVYEITR
jgi:release factor glutamine methyltransferase